MSQAPQPVLFRGARVLAMDAAGHDWPAMDVRVAGGVIESIGRDLPARPGERVVEARGHLLMPGLVNGHFHSPGNMMAGALVDMPLELFMLFEVPPLGQGAMGARLQYVQTLLGAAEMLKLGITAVHDDPYHNPEPSREAVDAIMQAYADAGMRATVSINHPNVVEHEKYPFLKQLLPADVIAGMDAARRWSPAEVGELYRWYLERWHGEANGRLRIAVSNSAPQRVTPEYFGVLSDFSKAHDLPFDIHILETRLQRVLGQQKFGKSLVRHVHDLGFLDRRMLVIHAIWIDEADIALLADSGCTVAHNPVCNLKLGSGVMPFRRLTGAGVPIALGTDERNTDDTVNLWGVMKTAGLIHKIAERDYRDWPTAAEVLNCAIRGGARGMGLEHEIGAIEPGRRADMILVDLDTLAFTPLNDLARQLVFCENGSSVRMVMVDGEIVVEDGRLTRIDEAALRAEVRELAVEFQAGFAKTAEAAARLEPYYREAVMRCASTDVGMQRWAGPMTP